MARRICVCSGAGCVASGAREVVAALRQELASHVHAGDLEVVETGCLGPCSLGPVVAVRPEGAVYEGVTPADAADIVAEAAAGAPPRSRSVQRSLTDGDPLPWEADIPFFARQTRVALRNVGLVDPFSIEDCVAQGAWDGLRQVLAGWSPERVIEEIDRAKLRGRGGAGFPTGAKWRMARLAASDVKYLVCNGDEGDPGAFMDRSLLEGDPHAVIEGMAIAAYAIGAARGFVYVRAEYPLAVERLAIAIGQARREGYLGSSILGTQFSFDIEIRMGSGAFVCGEETALLASIEGRRGEPRPRPPFPVESGLWGNPTVINNVETLACVPAIVVRGAAWHAALGTARSGGTKVFALAGAIRNTGLVEVPIGTTLRAVIFEIGGGMHEGRSFKAVQMGGPSGGCIPASLLDTPVDYDTLQAQGAIMGSGGMIVLDETSCMVDVARFFLEFTQEESCGKCAPCRIGTKRMLEIVTRICSGDGRPGDIERLIELGETIGDSALCGLGQTSPNPVLSTIRHFRAEYEAHIHDKRCPAGVCRKLVRYFIDPALCIGCTRCIKACPSGAIEGSLRQPHRIDTSRCIRCGACVDVCVRGAIAKS